MEADEIKLSSLKHHIDKMEKFANYMRDNRVADKFLRAIELLRNELYEAVDID